MTGAGERPGTERAPAQPARPTQPARPARPAGSRWPGSEVAPALALMVLGGYLVLATGTIRAPANEGSMGPQFFPYLVGGFLLVVGVVLIAQVVRAGDRRRGVLGSGSQTPQDPQVPGTAVGTDEGGEDVDVSRALDLRTVALLVAVLLAHVGLVERAGWPVAAGVLFGGSALVLGARRPLPLLITSVAVPAVAYLVFTQGLGVALPAGPFAGHG
jgi:putative tricarboxylic transport membrane protein